MSLKILQNRTKIVATIGPACSKRETLSQMIDRGLDVARFNFSHGEYEEFEKWLITIRSLSKEKGQPVAILLDLQGPRIRIGGDVPKKGVFLKKGEIVGVGYGKYKKGFVPIDYKDLVGDIKKGTRILLVDGLVELEVIKKEAKRAEAKVVVEGEIFPRKGVNIPNARLSLSTITEKDRRDLIWGIQHGVDYVGLSFVRSAEDIKHLKKLILGQDENSKIKIIAKIEKPEALKKIKSIIAEVDGVMVARGDLGIELPVEDLPVAQKKIISEAISCGKPVIVATQMMESMINNLRPTRAEISDVANAILDGTDAVMLSGETAVGKFPVQVIETITKIINEIEKEIFVKGELHFENISKDELENIRKGKEHITSADAVGASVKQLAEDVKAKYIIAATVSGYSARMVSRNRPGVPIVAVSPEEAVVNQLSLVWGVHSFYLPLFTSTTELSAGVSDLLKKHKLVRKGDKIILVSSHPLGKSGDTNLVKVEKIK